MKNRVKSAQNSNYDYSKLIAAAKEESQYISFTSFIDEKIHDLRIREFYGEAHRFNRSTLAKIIGINTSTLTKIINGSQATRKRDIIIALCFALKLTVNEANQALNLYPMAPLNRFNMRDLVIEQALCDGLSIPELNNVLKTHRFPILNILRDQKKVEDHSFYYPFSSSAYEEVSVNIMPYCVPGGGYELSLHDRYRPDIFNYHSEMVVRSKELDSLYYRIVFDSFISYEISVLDDGKWKVLYNDFGIDKYELNSICENLQLQNEITKLEEYTDRRARYVYNMCDDTRNYGARLNAVNDHGKLVIYGESFNYDAPELCEYYQFEVSSTGCVFTISNTSMFMQRYLGTEKWTKLYGKTLPPVNHRFISIDEISRSKWKQHFQKLLDFAYDLLIQLQEQKMVIWDAHMWIDIDELMHLFHVEEAFGCVQPNDLPYEIIPKKEQIIGPDGNPVTIDDLYRAAELDIYTLDDLCNIRTRYGSLEQFLQIDWLSEQKGNYHEE